MNRISLHVAKSAGYLLAILLPLACAQTRAEVILSEIMYDPQNSDTNREWVELFNTGTSAVNIGGWQFGLPSNQRLGNRAAGKHDRSAPARRLCLRRAPRRSIPTGERESIAFRSSNFPGLTNDPNDNVERRDPRHSQWLERHSRSTDLRRWLGLANHQRQ